LNIPILKAISIACASIAFICGMIAAYRWYEASAIELSFDKVNIGDLPDIRSDKDAFAFSFQLGVNKLFASSSRKNKRAATWTAWSVLFSAISSFAGAIS
jgi:hypothetical protein